MLCSEVTSGMVPYSQHADPNEVAKLILKGTYPSRPIVSDSISNEQCLSVWELAKKCWTVDAEARLPISQVIHEFNSFELAVRDISPLLYSVAPPEDMIMGGFGYVRRALLSRRGLGTDPATDCIRVVVKTLRWFRPGDVRKTKVSLCRLGHTDLKLKFAVKIEV